MPEINIVPLKFSNTELLNSIVRDLKRYFNTEINIISLNHNIENAFSKERNQYFSSQILFDISDLTSGYPGKIISVTEVDLFVPVLTFVFGEAQLNGKHAIISVCRLHEEFYSGISDDELLFTRTMKEILHELGHNFGLRHCLDWDCVMHSSQGIEEVDIKGSSYCRSCAKNIEGLKK